MITALYADGGCIGRNPSPIGGTWAWRHIGADGEVVAERSGVLVANSDWGGVTNNVSEFYALVNGLAELPAGWRGAVFSDSRISLGRLFQSWALGGLPMWLVQYGSKTLSRLGVARITFTLLDGHPTRAQLAAGIGKRGNPVSIHNVWCDDACKEQAKQFLQRGEHDRAA